MGIGILKQDGEQWTVGDLSGTSQTIAILDGHGVYELYCDVHTTANLAYELRFNSDDTGANYYSHGQLTLTSGNGATGNAWADMILLGSSTGTRRYGVRAMLNCKAGMTIRTVEYCLTQADATNTEKWDAFGVWKNATEKIAQIRLIATTGSFGTGSRYALRRVF